MYLLELRVLDRFAVVFEVVVSPVLDLLRVGLLEALFAHVPRIGLVVDAAVLVEAVDAEPAAIREGDRVGLVASDECPDALAVDVDVH